MSNSLHIANAPQIMFFETFDTFLIQDTSMLNVSKQYKRTIDRIIKLLYTNYDFVELEMSDEYFLFKKLILSEKNLCDNPETILAKTFSLPHYYKGFERTITAIEQVLIILIQTGHYREIKNAVMKKFDYEIKHECPFVQSVLHSDNTLSIGFDELNIDTVNALYLTLMNRWFFGLDEPTLFFKIN